MTAGGIDSILYQLDENEIRKIGATLKLYRYSSIFLGTINQRYQIVTNRVT